MGTFCGKCYVGVVTAGWGSGPNSCERKVLVEKLNATGKLVSGVWGGPSATHDHRRTCGTSPKFYQSTLVAGCRDGTKQNAVIGMLAWFKASKGISIAPE